MKNLFVILFLFTVSVCTAQAQPAAENDSVKQEPPKTEIKADAGKESKSDTWTKSWNIKLNDKQVAAINAIDAQVNQLNADYAKLIEAKNQYLKAILEAKDIDVSKIDKFQIKDGKLTFEEIRKKQ